MTKKEVTKKCQDILYERIPIDYEFLLNDVFPYHPEWDIKRGDGIVSVGIIETKYKNKCFYIERVDGTKTDISFTKCITNPNEFADIKKSCRSAIRNEIIKFRKSIKFGIDRCAITGELLEKHNTHIDHYDMNFNDLFIMWVFDKRPEDLRRFINPTKDNEYDTYFISEVIKNDFINFHNKNTNLRAVTVKSNLSRPKK